MYMNIKTTNMVLEDRIPCEICNSLIMFDDYIQHVEQCYITSQIHGMNRRLETNNVHNNISNDDTNASLIRRDSSIEDIGRIIQSDIGNFLSLITSNMSNISINENSNDNESINRLFRLETNNSNGGDNNVYTFVSENEFQDVLSFLPLFFNQNNNYEFNIQLQEQMGGDVSIGAVCLSNCYDVVEPETEQFEKCSICLETQADKKEDSDSCSEFVKTKCKHTYCKQCIDEWLTTHHTCPICVYDFNNVLNPN